MLTLIRFLYAHTARCTHGWRQPQIPCGFHSSGTTGDPPDGARHPARLRPAGWSRLWEVARRTPAMSSRWSASSLRNQKPDRSEFCRRSQARQHRAARRQRIIAIREVRGPVCSAVCSGLRGHRPPVRQASRQITTTIPPARHRRQANRIGMASPTTLRSSLRAHEQSAGSGSCVHRRFGRSTDGFDPETLGSFVAAAQDDRSRRSRFPYVASRHSRNNRARCWQYHARLPRSRKRAARTPCPAAAVAGEAVEKASKHSTLRRLRPHRGHPHRAARPTKPTNWLQRWPVAKSLNRAIPHRGVP